MGNEIFAAFERDLRASAELKGIPVVGMPTFDKQMSIQDRSLVGKAYNAVVKFLNDHSLYGSNLWDNNFCYSEARAMESYMPSTATQDSLVSRSIADSLLELCEELHIPAGKRAETATAMFQTLQRHISRTVQTAQWDNRGNSDCRPYTNMYPAAALSDVTFGEVRPGSEAFGASMDVVLPDVRLAMTVNLLKPHKGIMSRLIHRHTLAGSVIQYVIHADEFYDLTKSQNQSGDVRNSYDHRLPIVSLYRNPNPVQMQLVPIVPMKDKDTDPTNPKLVADGVMMFGARVNMFDLTLDPTKIGYNNYNYTDLVSEGVILDKVYFDLTYTPEGGSEITERMVVDVSAAKKSRLVMPAQVNDSGERATQLTVSVKMNKDTKTSGGAATAIFSTIDPAGNDIVELKIFVSTEINLKTAVAFAIANMTAMARTANGSPVTEAVRTLANSIKISPVGYSLDAKFSDENMRKVNMAVRTQTYTAHYELPQGKSIVVDFSMQQAVAEHVLNTGQEVQAIGIDHRNLQMFLKLMRHVHDQSRMEANDPNYRNANDGATLNTAFVSGQRVNPTVMMGSIQLSKVVNIRSSDMLGDIRQYVDAYLTKMISILHFRSLYVQQLNNGEIPTYKVLTSGPIIECLLSIPHIHNHQMPQGMDAERIYQKKEIGEPVEFVRILPSGVRLECISTTFDYMQDKIMIIPFHAADPASDLSFAHNWDGGQFVSTYTPVDTNQVNKRMYMNNREMPVPLCPSGLLITVQDLETILPDINTPIDWSKYPVMDPRP